MEQWNTEYQQNSGRAMKHQHSTGTPAENLEPYKTKNNCSDFKQNLNLTLIHFILSIQSGDIFYC